MGPSILDYIPKSFLIFKCAIFNDPFWIHLLDKQDIYVCSVNWDLCIHVFHYSKKSSNPENVNNGYKPSTCLDLVDLVFVDYVNRPQLVFENYS